MSVAVSHGLYFRSSDTLSALEPSEPGPMDVQKCRVFPWRPASSVKAFNTVKCRQRCKFEQVSPVTASALGQR